MAKFVRYEPCPRCVAAGRDRRGDNLATYDDGGWHCFSCGNHRGAVRYTPPAQEKIDDPKGVLPSDFTREVPTAGWQWLLQYGLGWKYWQPFVGWTERHSRLVFTVGDPIQFSIGRLIGKEPDKKERKWWVYGEPHRNPHILGEDFRAGPVVLVEDLISAHKVGQVATCIPLFGTRVFSSVIPCLRYLNSPIVMWLDSDQMGPVAVERATWLSLMTGLPVRNVFTKQDPKSIPLDKIKEIVSNG